MAKQQKPSTTGSRRMFLRTMPAAAALYATTPQPMPAQVPPADPIAAQADALAEVARLKFGSYLKDGDLADIKRVIERNLRYGEALAKIPIANSDEPDFMFIPNALP